MIITVTGPSGSGKSSMVRLLKRKYGVKEIISATTRSPRPREKDGVDYHFLSPEQFADTEMFESVEFGGNHYGTPMHEIHKAITDDYSSVYVIIADRKGAQKFRENIRGCFSVYIQLDPEFAMQNLIRRDGKKKAVQRIKIDAKEGLMNRNGYDCVLKNDHSIESLAYQFMNFVESRQWVHKTTA